RRHTRSDRDWSSDVCSSDLQFMSTDIVPELFEREIAPARMFVYYEEVESLMEKNLIKGGSLENAVVVRGDAVLSKEPLRFQDERSEERRVGKEWRGQWG